MNRKRTSALLIALCVIITFTAVLPGCGSRENDDKLIEAGLESAARMKEAVCSEAYRNIMSASAMVNDQEMVDIVSSENVNKYKAVYEVTFDPEKVLGTISDRFEGYDELSENLQKKIIAQVYGSLPSLINSGSGTTAMAFAALFNDGGSITHKAMTGRRTLVFVFESGCPVWVTYSSGDAGTVSYVSNWIVSDCTKIDSEGSLIKEFHLDNVPTVEVKKIR